MDIEEEIRRLKAEFAFEDKDVPTRLLSRGWIVTNIDVADDEPLEYFWPPTAPIGYGGLEERKDELLLRRYGIDPRSRPCPWLSPTTIMRKGSDWQVTYGRAIAQEPDPTKELDDATLLDRIVEIEWWPMSPQRARRLKAERILTVAECVAYDQFYMVSCMTETEPYMSRIDEIRKLIEQDQELKASRDGQPYVNGRWIDPDGDLPMRISLIEAEAWASAIRNVEAGGNGWTLEGPPRDTEGDDQSQ